jgi:hypothetical protein
MSFVYDEELFLFEHTYLSRGINSTISSFFVFRWLTIFWMTRVCALDTPLWLTLRAARAVQISLPADLSMFAITVTVPAHLDGNIAF